MLILRTLQWGPQHGHGIGQMLRDASGEALQLEHGSLYPALHRLEAKGWLDAEWKASETNRRAKYYRLTRAGRRQVARETQDWQQATAILSRFLKPAAFEK